MVMCYITLTYYQKYMFFLTLLTNLKAEYVMALILFCTLNQPIFTLCVMYINYALGKIEGI